MFNDNKNNNNNSILIDTNTTSKSSTRKRKINCVICFPKVELTLVNPEENRWKCPRCKNDYHLGFELLPTEDILESSHELEEDFVGLMVKENEFETDEDSDPG